MLLIRATALTGFVDLVDELGGSGAAALSRAGISRAAVGDFGSLIGYLAALEVVEAAAELTGAPDFGRRLAMRQDIEVLGPVGVAARTAPSVSAAISTLQRYLRAYTSAVVPRLVPAGPDRVLFHLERPDDLPYYPQGAEVGLGLSLRVVRSFIGPAWRPVAVDLAHQPLGDPQDYPRHYEAPARFGKPVTGFVMRTEELDRPLSGDAETHETLVRHLQSAAAPGPQRMVPVVDDLVRRLLPSGNVELATVAEELGLHPRTLQRRLEDEGVTFAELVQQVRRRTAESYLRDTDMTLRHLASELGYLEQSTLTRSSRRWFGTSPLAYRRALRALPDAAITP